MSARDDTKKDAPAVTEASSQASVSANISANGKPLIVDDEQVGVVPEPDNPDTWTKSDKAASLDRTIILPSRDNGSGPVIPPEPVNDPELLKDVVTFVRRYVVLTDAQADAIALWVAHTYAFAAADTTPYVAVTSAEKRSGKTRLLEVLELLVREPLPTANISDAALFRAIAKLTPTLLLDEVDAIFGPKARDREDLRGMLNAGYRRGAVALRMGGAKMTELQDFTVFCAKAFALIGDLPDTIADRAIRIRLERRTRDEPIERFRRRDVAPGAESLRDRLERWCEPRLDELRSIRPLLPDELDDRAQDCWEPLLALAHLAGGDWSERAHSAALTLSGPEARQDEDASLSVRMLADIHQVFSANGTMRYRTADLIAELCKIEESPWGDWFGKTITPQTLSKFLHPFRIKTMPVWIEGEKARGYKLEQFADAFLRHLGGRDGRDGRDGTQSQNDGTKPTALPPSPNQAVPFNPPSGGASTAPTTPTAQHTLNGAKPQPVNGDWNPDEQMAKLEEALRNRAATA
jgi:hypothetical protein